MFRYNSSINRCLELTAPTELIITKDEAPPENNCKRTI